VVQVQLHGPCHGMHVIQVISFQCSLSVLFTRIIHALLDHSEWFDRIYQELISTLEDTPDKVPASSLARLPVLNAVINETNRILPVATEDFERHVPSEGAQLGEYFIPGWCTVTLQMYSLHTDPNLWEDPDKFKPERWLKEHPTDALDEAIPFSRGVRVCIGRNLAMTEIRMLLAMLVYNFTFERVPGDDMTPFHFLSAEPAGQRLRVKVTERVH
jgi:cytochrome P450